MRGPLDVDNIQLDENYEANIPIAANPETVLRSYRQEFVLLMEAILGKNHRRTVELSHFFNMIRCEREWYRFEQIIYHPLLRSPMERFHYYIDGLKHLQYVQCAENKSIKDLFTIRWNEKVDIKGAVGGLQGFHGVLNEREYEDNVWGALEFSSNACLDVNDHLFNQEYLVYIYTNYLFNFSYFLLIIEVYYYYY